MCMWMRQLKLGLWPGESHGRWAALAGGILLLAVGTACADSITLKIENSTAAAGGSGSFDVVLAGGSATQKVAGFSIEIEAPAGSGISFSSVDTNTTLAYLFGAYQSAPSPFSSDSFPNTSFTASDADLTSPGYVTVMTGDNFGLAHVMYDVASGTAAGPVTVSFADIGGGTSLADENGSLISFTPIDGTIAVTGGSVTVTPLPASWEMGLAMLGLCGLGAGATRIKGRVKGVVPVAASR